MTTTSTCGSCGMPIETGRYCTHCTDENGQLQSFDQRFERMTAWQARRNPGTPREEIERQTLDYMSTMPAWRDHPRITFSASGLTMLVGCCLMKLTTLSNAVPKYSS